LWRFPAVYCYPSSQPHIADHCSITLGSRSSSDHTTVTMGAVVSCIKSVATTIGNVIMAIINGCVSVVKAILNGIVSIFAAIISCLTCGRAGKRHKVTTSHV